MLALFNSLHLACKLVEYEHTRNLSDTRHGRRGPYRRSPDGPRHRLKHAHLHARRTVGQREGPSLPDGSQRHRRGKSSSGNTFHLYLRPGDELVGAARAACTASDAWDKPILTDRGRLFRSSAFPTLRTIKEEGGLLRSHLDGSKHLFSPEKVVSIQAQPEFVTYDGA